jgi:predicted DNA-binding transcriptional regulator AlpA
MGAAAKAKTKTPQESPAMMSVRDTMSYLGWSEWRVWEAAKRGWLPSRRLGRRIWFVRAELDEWLRGERK